MYFPLHPVVVPPAGWGETECVFFLFLSTLFINFTTEKRKLAQGFINMKSFNVYTGLLVCIELYLIYILEKLHEQTPNLRVMQGHYNIIHI